MSWLGDIFKFEQFNLGNQWDKLKKNPERAFIGAMDEGSTKVWNKAFDLGGIHKNYEPMTDYWGGAPKDSYTKAEAAGINTGPGRSMHNVAKTITSLYAGGYGADKLGLLGGTSDAINPSTGLSWEETGSGLVGNGGYGAEVGSNINPATGLDWAETGSGLTGNGADTGYSGMNDYLNQAGINSDGFKATTKPSFQQLLGKQLMQGGLGGMSGQRGSFQYQEQPVQRQGAFAPTPAPLQVQDKQSDIATLIALLKKKEFE